MKKFILPIISAFFLIIIQSAQAQQFTLVKRGTAKSRIIIPEKATVIEIQAAKVLQDYIQRISGASIPIEADNTQLQKGEILIGNVNRPELKEVPKEKLDKDGLFIKNNGSNLVITGGTDKGILYGVYTFLEKYMGCRKYSSAVTYVPKKKTIVLSSINDMELPAFTYRETFYRDAVDPGFILLVLC
jgi:alpha-glucuronidase